MNDYRKPFPTTLDRAIGVVGGIVGGLFLGVLSFSNAFLSPDDIPTDQAVFAAVSFLMMCLCFLIAYRAATAAPKPTGPINKSDLLRLAQELYRNLESNTRDGAFAVVMFRDRNQSSPESYNAQYSVEDSKIGFDWVLNGPLNNQDRETVESFAHKHGIPLELKEANGMQYLRYDGARTQEFMKLVLTELYDVSSIDHFTEYANR